LFRGRRGRQKSEAAAVMKQVREADEIAVRLEAGVIILIILIILIAGERGG